MDKGMFNIYEEIEDDFLVNLLFVKTEVVILTANTFEKNILYLNAVKARKQKICHYIINSCNNPRRPLDINVYFFEMEDYHVLHMEEKQTIVALGAGAITKRVYPDGCIERCENVKDVALYIEKIDEMIERKRRLLADF